MTVNKLTNSPSSGEPLDPPASGLSAGQSVYRLRVAVDAPQHSGIGAPLDYLCEHSLSVGSLIRVPFGRRMVTGVVWPGAPEGDLPEASLKRVDEVWGALPPLPGSWLRLVEFTASYYQRGIGEVALSVLPPELRQLDATQLARRLKRLQRELDKEVQADHAAATAPDRSPDAWPEPSPEQAAALTALAAPQPEGAAPRVTLLHGSTGSGKTEVYLREVQRVLDAGRQALVLVPEINLTPQLHGRFAARFGSRRVVALHSGLTPAQRLQHWLRAHLGHADVVLGTRLAVFTPLPRLGLVVVDEEHEPSYKQQEGARYSARDLAVMRGRIEGVPVILGSATPSIETWHNALPASEGGAGRYQRLAMPARIGGGGMPTVRLLDMSRLPKTSAQQELPLAGPLLQAITERIERGEQSLVFLNRRGYAPVLHCADCGWKSGCPHCSAWRVFHKVDRTLRCHHCGLTERVPRACPDCGNQDIRPMGRGTEKLEEQLAEALPGARVGRIDADVTRLKGALEAQLASVHAGEVDVLVGTQMVAKGHDFRRITLVAAVNPDSALFSADFRAGERLFALLMQAAGRAGRDAEAAARSEMWIQTWNPQHPLYAALKRYDYEAFAASQLEDRQAAGLPPFAHLALLRAEGRTQEAAQAYLAAAAQLARELPESAGVTLYPPVPTTVAKVADVERAQMLVEAPQRLLLQRFLQSWTPQLHALARDKQSGRPPIVRWAVDVDPLEI